MIGTTLLHYRVLHRLGAGGMAEVYAAEDTRLRRRVALKILPRELANDPERLARFQREAQAVASLNHPNVVTIHAVEEHEGIHFLTMELVEGRTLAELIPADGMPVADLLRIAVPIADAIGAAHKRGITHRDIKPANIMMDADGRLRVLDFGLAKLKPHSLERDDQSLVSTIDPLTRRHVIIGTASYMSPEQAEGRAVDGRSDVFSLGIVLYELATGTRPFHGDTSLSVISSILKDTPPPLSAHRPDLPAELERIIGRCLAKDPLRRYQHADDLRNDLEELRLQLRTGQVPAAAAPRAIVVDSARSRIPIRWALPLAAAVVAVVGVTWWMATRDRSGTGTDTASGPLRASFTQVTSQPGTELFTSLSPDGKWVVYASAAAGNLDIYLQSVSGTNAINLTADSKADDDEPAFSPDGERIVFRSERDGGGLYIMGRTGESATRLTTAGHNPAWSKDGNRIAFSSGKIELKPQNTDTSGDVFIVEVRGGPPKPLIENAVMPTWSADGSRIAFTRRYGSKQGVNIWTVPTTGGDGAPLTETQGIDWNPVWSHDGRFVYFSSDRGGSMNLWRVAVDQATGKALGAPEAITTPAPFVAHLSISADGRRLAYSAVQTTQNIQRMSLDPASARRVGEPVDVTTGSRLWSSPDPSPDGSQVAYYTQVQPEGHLYVSAPDGSGLRQLIGDQFIDRVPRWSRDGKWIAWFSNRPGGLLQLWMIRPDGSDRRQLTFPPQWGSFMAWGPDGRMAATHNESTGAFIFDPATPLAAQQVLEIPSPPLPKEWSLTAWSPDGNTLVGHHDPLILGTYSLRTKEFKTLGSRGEWPTWLPDSRRVLFVSGGKRFATVDVRTGEEREIYTSGRDIIGPPRLTRDGRMMFFSRRVNEADLWVVTLDR